MPSQRRKALRGHPFSYGESLYGSGQRGSALICAGGKSNVIRNSNYLIRLDKNLRNPDNKVTENGGTVSARITKSQFRITLYAICGNCPTNRPPNNCASNRPPNNYPTNKPFDIRTALRYNKGVLLYRR